MSKFITALVASSLSVVISACTGGNPKDRLEYEHTSYKKYCFGKNSEILIPLPLPSIAVDPSDLYSNMLRGRWVGNGLIGYAGLSDIRITNGENENRRNKITIYLRTAACGFLFYREIVIVASDGPIVLTVCTTADIDDAKNNERFIAEDSDLFIKTLQSIRIKGKTGKMLRIKVDIDSLRIMINKMAVKASKPLDADDEMGYELVEE